VNESGFRSHLLLYRGLLLAVAVGGVMLFAVLRHTPPAPPCRVEPSAAETARGNAGCLIRVEDRMLVVRDRLSERLGFPAGMSVPGEAAQCTAHREAWEETGLEVVVGQRLQVFENGFRLYACKPVDPSVQPGSSVAVPQWAWAEIAAVEWIDPFHVFPAQWRYPEEWPVVLDRFRALDETLLEAAAPTSRP
jgi:8-oxo-dGTP pyrophosphatase MutT (NUDIX family)